MFTAIARALGVAIGRRQAFLVTFIAFAKQVVDRSARERVELV
jgi:hypothetical protein